MRCIILLCELWLINQFSYDYGGLLLVADSFRFSNQDFSIEVRKRNRPRSISRQPELSTGGTTSGWEGCTKLAGRIETGHNRRTVLQRGKYGFDDFGINQSLRPSCLHLPIFVLTRETGKNDTLAQELKKKFDVQSLCTDEINGLPSPDDFFLPEYSRELKDLLDRQVREIGRQTGRFLGDKNPAFVIELPCVESRYFANTSPEIATLYRILLSTPRDTAHHDTNLNVRLDSGSCYDYIILTSGVGAEKFVECWNKTKINPESCQLNIVSIGSSVTRKLEQVGISPVFVPRAQSAISIALALPGKERQTTRVLTVTSARAPQTLQEILQSRTDATFNVDRLNIYDTTQRVLTPRQKLVVKMLQYIQETRCTVLRDRPTKPANVSYKLTPIICFASGSAVASWCDHLGPVSLTAGCIGASTANQAKNSKYFARVLRPPDSETNQRPALQRWVQSLQTQLENEWDEDDSY